MPAPPAPPAMTTTVATAAAPATGTAAEAAGQPRAPRRRVLRAAAAGTIAGLCGAARAHHGWSGFDEGAPLFLAGTVRAVRWTNPHAELVVDVAPALALPADLARRAVPAQQSPVDVPRLLARAALPRTVHGQWVCELAPLLRMEAWGIAEPRPGAVVEVVGYAAPGEARGPVLRVEVLFVDGRAYGLRSMPRG